MHEDKTLDFQRWMNEFPMERIIAQSQADGYWSPRPTHIASPVHLVINNQLRSEQADALMDAETVACDVFLWALGESPARTATKIGGLPFRPGAKPWPAHENTPFTFLAQFNFAASRDLVGSTPGDVLLIFTLSDDFEVMCFEWYDFDESDLIERNSIPDPCFSFITCHGERHRTVDFRHFDRLSVDERLCALECTKIGGVPCFHGAGEFTGETTFGDERWVTNFDGLVKGRFLCCLGPVQADPYFEFPFTNNQVCLTLDGIDDPNHSLLLGDMGSLFFFLEPDGSLNYWHQFS